MKKLKAFSCESYLVFLTVDRTMVLELGPGPLLGLLRPSSELLFPEGVSDLPSSSSQSLQADREEGEVSSELKDC
jgi:hypothetical protein